MVFPSVLFSFSVGTMGKIYCICRKYSLGNFHTCHPKISSDTQVGELVGVKKKKFEYLPVGDPMVLSYEL